MSDNDETLLKFPCRFPIKAMGKGVIGLESTVIEIVRKHAPDLGSEDVRIKPSRNGRYISVTVNINATSKAQLDNIYLGLTSHPDILMAF